VAGGHEAADGRVDLDRVGPQPVGLLAVQELLDGVAQPALAVDLGHAPADRVDVDGVGPDRPGPQPGDPLPGRGARRPGFAVGQDRVQPLAARADQAEQVAPDRGVDVAHVDQAGGDPFDLLEHEQAGEVGGPEALERDAPARGGIGHGGQQALDGVGLAWPYPGTDGQGDLVRHGPTPVAGR
jgi:hypothetical protein